MKKWAVLFFCFFYSYNSLADVSFFEYKKDDRYHVYVRMLGYNENSKNKLENRCQNGTINLGWIARGGSTGSIFMPNQKCSSSDLVVTYVKKYIDSVGLNVWVDSGLIDGRDIIPCLYSASTAGGRNAILLDCGSGHLTPTDESCTSSTTGLYFDYGNISNSDVNGHALSNNLEIMCSGDITAKISAGTSMSSLKGRIPLDGDGFYAQIVINGSDINDSGKTMSLAKGLNELDIRSRLVSSGKVSNKNYNESGIILIEPQ